MIYWPTFYCLQFVRNVDSEKREADTFSAFIIYLAPSFFYYYSLAFFLFTALLFSIPPFIGILSKVLYYHKIKLPGIYFPARNKVIIMPGWGFYPFFSLARAPCFTPCVIVREFFFFFPSLLQTDRKSFGEAWSTLITPFYRINIPCRA